MSGHEKGLDDMLDEKILELIHKEIDGVILPGERTVLDACRATNPEVAETERDLRIVASALGSVQPVEAPATLKSRVMNSISPSPRREPAYRRIAAPFFDVFRGRPGFRAAHAFSLGLIAGIALF